MAVADTKIISKAVRDVLTDPDNKDHSQHRKLLGSGIENFF